MLHIVLTILAVIGKILLGLLGFILLLLILLLFVPVRYKGTFQKQDKELQAKASVSWLLRFVYVQVSWIEKKLSFEIRVLGIPILRLLNRIKGRKTKTKDPVTETESVSEEKTVLSEEKQGSEILQEEDESAIEKSATEEAVSEEAVSEEAVSEEVVTEETATEEPIAEKTEEYQEETAEHSEEQEMEAAEKQPKEGFFKKAASFFRKAAGIIRKLLGIPQAVVHKLQAIADKLKSVFDKIETMADKAREILELLRSKLFKEVFVLAKKEVLAILRHILPTKLWGRVEFGAGDPGTTGEILAAIAAIYPILPKKLVLRPDFEEALLNCDLSLKGRIRLVVLVFHGVKLILNKQVRRLIKKVRHKEAK